MGVAIGVAVGVVMGVAVGVVVGVVGVVVGVVVGFMVGLVVGVVVDGLVGVLIGDVVGVVVGAGGCFVEGDVVVAGGGVCLLLEVGEVVAEWVLGLLVDELGGVLLLDDWLLVLLFAFSRLARNLRAARRWPWVGCSRL